MKGVGGIISLLLVIWLVVGAFAAFQRGYFGDDKDVKCKEAGDTILTVVAGPLNYMGVNPKIKCKAPNAPKPSK